MLVIFSSATNSPHIHAQPDSIDAVFSFTLLLEVLLAVPLAVSDGSEAVREGGSVSAALRLTGRRHGSMVAGRSALGSPLLVGERLEVPDALVSVFLRVDEHLLALLLHLLQLQLLIAKRLRHLLVLLVHCTVVLAQLSDLLELILEFVTMEVPRSIICDDEFMLERSNLSL